MVAERVVVSVENGLPGWSRAAVDVLVEAAAQYNATVTEGELAEEVQSRSGRWANVSSRGWVRKVLQVVTLKCTREEWPYLAALVVRPSDGRVGAWYDDVLAVTGPGSAPDAQHHAAQQRLDCYRQFGAEVPQDAQPQLVSRARSSVTRAAAPTRVPGAPRPAAEPKAPRVAAAAPSKRKPPEEPRRGALCPSCFMEMSLAGTCANCD